MYTGEENIIQPLFNPELPGIVHGAFTRHGGASSGLFATNNISFGVGDDAHHVSCNRKTIKRRLGLDYLVSAHQVHGSKIHQVKSPINNDYIADDSDALMTDVAGVGIMIGHADCQAVLLYDQLNSAVAAVHSGWRGSVANIVASTIIAMQEQYNTQPEQLVAAIGPSLGPCCAEFVHYEKELPFSFQRYMVDKNHFDFWEITRDQLIRSGVPGRSISSARICTVCSSDYFSYRRACRVSEGVTGRNGSLIALR